MANGLVEYSIEAKPEIKSIFESVGVPTPAFNQLKKNNKQSMDAFKNAISKAKQSLGNNGASVELKDDYTDINLYLSDDGESGFGIKPNGDIVSVFSSSKEKGRSSYMLEMAISQGGRQLDCFDIYLTKIYETHGFKPVAKMKWNDEYIPEGWNKDNFKDYNNGEPDVVFMAYDPNNDIEKQHESLEDTMEEIEKKRGYRYKRKTREEKIPYIYDYDDGEKFQHQYKWRSPAEREAIYNNMLERYKNAKTTEELKKVVFDNDKPLEVFNRQLDDLGSLSKEQAQSIRAEYSKRYLELIKDENPEEYKKNKKYLEKKYNIKSDASVYIDSLIDTIEYIDAKKKEFREEDVNRDKDGKFAPKNSSSNKSNDNDKSKDNKSKKDGLDYGDLPKELHEPFKRLNTVKKAGEYIFNKNNEYKITEKDIKKKTDTYRKREKPDWVYVNLHNYYKIDDFGEHIGEPMNLTNRDNLKSDIEKFLFDFTCNSDEAKEKWGEKFESEIKPKLKQMIKNAPIPKGMLYRVETWTHGRDIEVGKSINFDCRSSADDNMGYEVAVNFSQEDYEAGEEIYIFEFPEGTNALNIQGVSTYINEHEYLVDGDFIIESIEEDEFGYKQVKLVRPEDYEPPEPEDEEDEEDEEDGILDLRKYNEDEDDDDNYSPFDNFDPNWKPSPYGSDDDY